MIEGIRLGNVMLDCADAIKLRDFYAALLGWEKCELYNHLAVRSREGVVFLFGQDEDYIPPVWPDQAGKQQKQMHLDFQVSDLAAAVKQAEALGAVKALTQYGEPDDFVTMLDPAGHPFCLCRD